MNNSLIVSHECLPDEILEALPSIEATLKEKNPIAFLNLLSTNEAELIYVLAYDKTSTCMLCLLLDPYFEETVEVKRNYLKDSKAKWCVHFEPCPVSELLEDYMDD